MKHLKTYKIFESEENLDAFQSEYDALVSKLKQAEEEVKEYEKSLNDKKLYVNKGKVKKVVDTWGIFWNVTIYDHYDGHAGDWIFDSCQGAVEMKEEPSDAIRELITCWDILSMKDKNDKLNEAFENPGDIPWRFTEKIIEDWNNDDTMTLAKGTDNVWVYNGLIYTVGDASLNIKAMESGRHDEGDVKRDSFIEFKLTSDKEIKSTKSKSKYGNQL